MRWSGVRVLADRALERIDFEALRTPEHREAVLDAAWLEFTSPQALTTAQILGEG